MTEEKLQLKFDPRTIEHLGIKMYSQLPYALAELVANAYDADATEVTVMLYDNVSNDKRIIIRDNGDGMSYEEVKENFLVIGRKRRDTDSSRTNSSGRKITGKKGLGKLALFGIGKTITIETTKSGEELKTQFTMDWDSILGESSGTYYPTYKRIRKDNIEEKGTTITLYNLSRKTSFDLNATDKNYYQAFYEAMKRYKNAVKEKANISESEDRAIVSKAFGKDAVLETTANHKCRPNGQLFDIQTIENIEEGQKFLSMGAVCGGRNVVSHEEISDLKEAGLFSEKDCLDLLSLLSHLFKRLDESKKRT